MSAFWANLLDNRVVHEFVATDRGLFALAMVLLAVVSLSLIRASPRTHLVVFLCLFAGIIALGYSVLRNADSAINVLLSEFNVEAVGAPFTNPAFVPHVEVFAVTGGKEVRLDSFSTTTSLEPRPPILPANNLYSRLFSPETWHDTKLDGLMFKLAVEARVENGKWLDAWPATKCAIRSSDFNGRQPTVCTVTIGSSYQATFKLLVMKGQ
jgi:hypothetical protein